MSNKSDIAKQKSNCRAQLDFYIVSAKTTIKKFGEHVPIFFLEKKPDGLAMVVPDFRTDEAKDKSVMSIRLMLTEYNSDFYVHVSEAWMIQRKPEDDIERPSLAKDKQEILMIVFCQRDGKMVEVMIPFSKGNCGKIFFEEPREHYSGFGADDDFEQCGGRFAELRGW